MSFRNIPARIDACVILTKAHTAPAVSEIDLTACFLFLLACGRCPCSRGEMALKPSLCVLAGASASQLFFTAVFRDSGCYCSNAAVTFCSLGLGPGLSRHLTATRWLRKVTVCVSQCVLECFFWMLGYCPSFRNHNSCYLIQPFLPPCCFQRG